MPITPEQRQVLLDRLKLAREAKDKKKAETLAAKSSAPSAPKDIKSKIKVAPKAKKEPPIVLKQIVEEDNEVTEDDMPAPSAPIPIPLPSAPKGKVVVLDENHPDIKREIEELHAKKAKAQPAQSAQKQKKDAYAKIVFYKEPSRKKMDTLMKSLHEETSSEEEDDEAAEQHYVPPPRTQRQAVPQQMRHLPQVSDRTEFMRQLARQYYN
jgi:DNA repair exonuclease SbcCD ATPase subunit